LVSRRVINLVGKSCCGCILDALLLGAQDRRAAPNPVDSDVQDALILLELRRRFPWAPHILSAKADGNVLKSNAAMERWRESPHH